MTARRAAALVTGALLLAGCTDDAGPTPAAGTATSAPGPLVAAPDAATGRVPAQHRVLTVAPGSGEVETVADLADTSVATLVTGPAGWVHLQATRSTGARSSVVVLPLDLTGGGTAAPVELCAPRAGEPSGAPVDDVPRAVLGVTRSGSGSTLLAWANCTVGDSRLVVLSAR